MLGEQKVLESVSKDQEETLSYSVLTTLNATYLKPPKAKEFSKHQK